MGEQSMLPFHDMPITPSTRAEIAKRAVQRRSASKPLGRNFVAALHDPARVVFLDVETTGLSWHYDEITIVGWACDRRYHVHIAGEQPGPLLNALRNASALITFNGTLFDLRFLRKAYSGLALPAVHIDLRYLARRAGLSGGQKVIEKVLGLPARTGFDDVDGAEAVLLWHRYLRGDVSSLRRLIEYNRYDVLGMCGILDDVLDRLDIHPDFWLNRFRFSDHAYSPVGRADTSSELPFNTSKQPRGVTFKQTFAGTPAEHAGVVGIDLTGSESRPSGWCYLRASHAVTDMIASDGEIVERTLAIKPDVISIDSPLSIPFGRNRVEDDDPAREEFGIMRRCERELKRRGINVYPCLLPSMQRLTGRGMHLATKFRAAGVPVIESYPGAAQDIMGIPRKRAGVEFLKQGLADFGVRGDFIDNPVRHDELDAITSALVGSFFLAGKFEALRGPMEDALIIPDLETNRPPGMVLGISGRICAGKTTVARLLEQRGFAYTRFSLVIDDEIIGRGETPNRQMRQRMGMAINRTKGQRWLCQRVLDRVAGRDLIVVDGLRFPEDHAFLVETFGSEFFHLHIVAPTEVRAARYRAQEKGDVPFAAADCDAVEAKIDNLAGMAKSTIANDSTIEALSGILDDALEEFARRDDRSCRFPS
jgi:uncharacterized protein YprB with RNaseH-like and TPR domain/predicted nuclease with RNAse H fold/dephospho-CoA kinase